MARKQAGDIDSPFRRTEGQAAPGAGVDTADLDKGRVMATGIGLREGEIAALDAIAQGLGGVSRNALLRFAVRYFLLEYRKGDIDLSDYVQTPPPPKKTLRLPGDEV